MDTYLASQCRLTANKIIFKIMHDACLMYMCDA